jgi:uncharacterized protein involved in exopolysaccharide biosynthesis
MQGRLQHITPKYSEEDSVRIFLSPRHLRRVLRKSWKTVAFAALAIGGAGTAYALLSQPSYSVEAVVRAGDPNSLTPVPPKRLLRSRALLEPVVRELGLQASLRQGQGTLGRWTSRITGNLRSEAAHWLGGRSGSMADSLSPLTLRDVEYHRHDALTLKFEMLANNRFRVIHRTSGEIGRGVLGERFSSELVSFTAQLPDGAIAPNGRLQLHLASMGESVKNLKRRLRVMSTGDREIYRLTYTGSQPVQAAELLNALMAQYERYLITEALAKTELQIVAFRARTDEVLTAMNLFLEAHRPALVEAIQSGDLLDYPKQLQTLTVQQDEIVRRGADLQLDVEALEGLNGTGSPVTAQALLRVPELRPMLARLEDLRYRREAIDQDHDQYLAARASAAEWEAEERQLQAELMEKRTRDIRGMLASLEGPNRGYRETASVEKDGELLAAYLEQLGSRYESGSGLARRHRDEDLSAYVDVEGIDLDFAAEKYLDVTANLGTKEVRLAGYRALMSSLKSDTSNLTVAEDLQDPLAQELANDVMDLSGRIEAEVSNGADVSQLESYLGRKTRSLTGHAQDRMRRLERELSRDIANVNRVQNRLMELLDEEISHLSYQITDTAGERLVTLQEEQVTLQDQLHGVNKDIAALPRQWAAEKEWEWQSELSSEVDGKLEAMFDALAASQPEVAPVAGVLDSAVPPVLANPPRILGYLLLGMLSGACLGFMGQLSRGIVSGFVATPDAVQAIGCHVAGTTDLPSLRRALAYLRPPVLDEDKKRRRLVCVGTSEEATRHLVQLLHRKGDSVVAIEIPEAYEGRHGAREGLIQFLEGKSDKPRIERRREADWIRGGGATPYMSELLDTQRWKELLDHSMEKYDWVLLVYGGSPVDFEAQGLIQTATHLIVQVGEERFHELQPYFPLSRGTSQRVTFLFDSQ